MHFLLLLFPLVFSSPQSPQEGVTLFAPMASHDTHLLDLHQNVVHTWTDTADPGLMATLRENGNLLRTYQVPGLPASGIGGAGGGIHELAWDSSVVWDFQFATNDALLHHDFVDLPNGNILLIAWERKDQVGALAAGRDPLLIFSTSFWSEMVLELEPSSGTIVWEWHAWDHLVQDFDPTKPNFGVVADNPQLTNLNFPPVAPRSGDWLHFNAIDYNAAFDQIVLSSRALSEIWIIDHSTTTAEAASHSGGNSGKGGDLLYRWGNPAAYDRGTPADQTLFRQHDIQWIADDRPGAGNLLVFNNGVNRLTGTWSSVDEFAPPVSASGDYALTPGATYGPTNLVWTYFGSPQASFIADHISGTERLANGNTLICNGPIGQVFEVDSTGSTRWDWTNTFPVLGSPLFKVRRYERSLWADQPGLSLAAGGSLDFHLLCGPGYAGHDFVLLGSMTGTSPGAALAGGLVLPLNSDGLTSFIFNNPTAPGITGSRGHLDALGNANPSLDSMGPLPSSMSGRTLHFAFALVNPIEFTSNAVAVVVLP
jgi:hypothetical protein